MNKACQSIYQRDGSRIFEGEWDSRTIYDVLSRDGQSFWTGKSVLDIGANSCGLSIEIARQGASVTALEPDPYRNTYAVAKDIVQQIINDEKLQLTVVDGDLFSAHTVQRHDVVLCLGLLYHFRYPQYILDYLSTLGMDWLFISTQVSKGESFDLVNRASPGVLKEGLLSSETILTGWHPTRPLMSRMLRWAGFTEITSLTNEPYVFPDKQKGLTNSAYFRAKRISKVDPELAKREFYPR